MLVQEPRQKPRVIEMNGSYKDIRCKCIINTGSTYNLIKRSLIDKDRTLDDTDQEIKLETVNGIEINATKCITFELMLQGDTSYTYKVKSLVLDNIQPDIILGIPFLQENDAKIDFRNNTITLDGKEYEFGDPISVSSLDKKLIDKSKILTIQENNLEDVAR
ncbi:hypothetical protein DMUE_3543 [Dictyocoela muelleri]|nr:hypothetical protein DMUE_3543 [Dictyocoela muelleri]